MFYNDFDFIKIKPQQYNCQSRSQLLFITIHDQRNDRFIRPDISTIFLNPLLSFKTLL